MADKPKVYRDDILVSLLAELETRSEDDEWYNRNPVITICEDPENDGWMAVVVLRD